MNVQISAPKSDQGTEHIAAMIRPHLAELSRALSGEYGGIMEHLWIDLELCPGDADRRDAFCFRFQKRVAPQRSFLALGAQEHFNVGHFSVRPDYFDLARVPMSDVVCYLTKLIYEGTETLGQRQQIGNFDVRAFREKFAAFLSESGCTANKQLQPSTREDARAG